ncbi:hypothetical protein M5585_21265 [Serratia ureilytica]
MIRIDDGKYSLLLTGDAEKRAEAQLLRLRRDRLTATVLQVGHHGSKTSSTPPFCARLIPKLRWRPHLVTVNGVCRRVKWSPDIGQMALHGTIRHAPASCRCFFDNDWQIKGFREQLMPRWYHQRFGVEGDNE